MRMQKKNGYFVSFRSPCHIVIGVLGGSFVFARGPRSSVASTNSISSAQRVVASMTGMQTVNMQSVPAGTATSLYSASGPAKRMPLLTGNPALYAQHKAAAVHNIHAPFANPVSNTAVKAPGSARLPLRPPCKHDEYTGHDKPVPGNG